MSSSIVKDIILNATTPIVLKNYPLDWKCFRLSTDEWCTLFDPPAPDKPNEIYCDVGRMEWSEYPQWERTRKKSFLTMRQILCETFRKQEHLKNCWVSYSYKNVKELPDACQADVNFCDFGFPQTEDAIFWFGSAASHTPCHYDSNGCNIVVQVFGHKSWLLFPPDAQLTPTRVPYEETSIYCKENFFSPLDVEQFEKVKNQAHHVMLGPGDVLIVPRKWWHYVENIDTALAINSWIPLECDLQSQIEECIVKMQIANLTVNLSESFKKALINPNEICYLYEELPGNHADLLKNLISCSIDIDHRKRLKINQYKYQYLSADEYAERLVAAKCNFQVECVPKLKAAEFHAIVEKNSKRYTDQVSTKLENYKEYQNMFAMINAFCNPNVIDQIRVNYINEVESMVKKDT